MSDWKHDIELLRKIDSYRGETVCPRCFSGYPCCTDFKKLAREAVCRISCQKYIIGDLCETCQPIVMGSK